jgi:nucleoside-diphosphate-sugar epimerase
VLDAGERLGMRRVVAVSTGTFFDTSGGLEREDAPVTKKPSSDPYTLTKMAAFEDAMARAAAGQDVVTTHPGAIFGPSPVVSNALGKTSFNRVLLSALRQRIQAYLRFPVSWVFADDIARGCILALDRGVSGERYMLDGRPEDVVSTAVACSRICELAGMDHRVADIEPSDDPEVLKVFGPTLVAIAAKAAKADKGPRRSLTDSKTYKRLGYDPISLDDGLIATTAWLRELDKF